MLSPRKCLQSLKQGDPQAVAVAAVSVFVASVLWFSWTLLFPPQAEPLPLGSGPGRTGRTTEAPVRLSRQLEEQQGLRTGDDAPNPFFRAPPPQPPPRERPDPPPQPPPVRNPENPQVEAPAPPPPPRNPQLKIQYLGVLVRPDHTAVALVNLPDGDGNRFLKTGDEISGFVVGAISSEGMQMQLPNGPMEFLPRGELRSYEVPR